MAVGKLQYVVKSRWRQRQDAVGLAMTTCTLQQ